MKTITFYSYKGGVGRSLALSNIAKRLSELKKKVCILDFDLDAPGLQFKFANNYTFKPIEKGLVDYISEFSTKGIIPTDITQFSTILESNNINFADIDLIPAGNIYDNEYWKKLSMISWSDMFYSSHSQGIQFFLDLKHKIETELKPDFLLIDSRTGITDISGITLRLFADEIVILAVNNDENIFGSKMIIKNLLNEDSSLFGVLPKINFVLTRIPFTDTAEDRLKKNKVTEALKSEFEDYLNLKDFQISLIHSDRRLEEKENQLIGYILEEKSVSISNDYLKLFNLLTSGLLSKEELGRLDTIKKAENEYLKYLNEPQILKKLEHLNNALSLDPTKINYLFARANLYNSLGDNESALSDSLALLESIQNDNFLKPQLVQNIAIFYLNLNQFDLALKYVEEHIKQFGGKKSDKAWILKAKILDAKGDEVAYINTLNHIIDFLHIEDAGVYNDRADYHRKNGRYDQAYIDIRKAIEMNPEESVFFATLAEISEATGKMEDFYLYLTLALSKKLDLEDLTSSKSIYLKYEFDAKFLEVLNKYDIDFEAIRAI